MSPKVFIIILNWNGWKDTIECLKSLEKLDYPNYEIIVVDNNSTDNSAEKLREYINSNIRVNQRSNPRESASTSLQMRQTRDASLQIILITNESNLGFAGGNNVGIKYILESRTKNYEPGVNNEYILLLNNDTIVDKNFLQELVGVGESDKKIGILGPLIYYYDESKKIQFGGGKIEKFMTRGVHMRLNEIDQGQFSDVDYSIVDYYTGCALMIKKEVIDKIGLMPEDYFLYYEDVAWNLKAKKAGYFSVIVPKSKIWHKVSASAKQGSPSYIYYHSRNGLLLAKRNAPFFIRQMAYLYSFWLLGKQVMKFIIMPSKRVWARNIIRGILDFYKGKTGQIL